MQARSTPLAAPLNPRPLLRAVGECCRSPHILLLGALVAMVGALRFVHLGADFPNDSPWMIDQAKFTDEGWWAGAAVMHFLTGHWYVSGDYNPAVVLPVWPLLLGVIFHFTGVSVVAARALTAAISLASVVLVYALVRRYEVSGSGFPALAAAALLAFSPIAFAFSRLAILDTLVVFEFCLALLLASAAKRNRFWPWPALAAVITLMLLTKTTSAALLPAILWLAWAASGRSWTGFLRAALAVAAVPAILCVGYVALVSALGYGADYNYFFAINALEDFVWRQSFTTFMELLQNGFWIDRVLYPAALVILILAIAWLRRLWLNPLFGASWLAIAAQAGYIFRLQEDYAPRYFLVMLVPAICVVILALDDLALRCAEASPSRPAKPGAMDAGGRWANLLDWSGSPKVNSSPIRFRVPLAVLLAVILVSVAINGWMIQEFIAHPVYQFRDAANSIQAIVRGDSHQNPWIIGVSGAQLSLMSGIPSLNDGYGTEDLGEKVARYQPGWYLVWTGVPADPAFLSQYQLEESAAYPVFDDDGRTPLILYKLVSRTR